MNQTLPSGFGSWAVSVRLGNGDLETLAAWSCALLNESGGVVFAPAGDPPHDPALLSRRLGQSISPPIALSVSHQPENQTLVVDVPDGANKPYVFDGKIMVRGAEGVAPAAAADLARLFRGRPGATRWERSPALGAEAADFDAGAVERFARRARESRGVDWGGGVAGVLGGLGLTQGELYANAAVVLFGRNPTRFFPQVRARAARFEDDSRSGFLDNQYFDLNLFDLVERLAQFVTRNSPVAATIFPDALTRIDRPTYPLAAVREAIVNAVVHRDYSGFDGGVTIALFPDRLEVGNSGRLPEGMSVEDLRVPHPSRPNNPDIAQAAFLAGLMERWGIGTQRIIQTCAEAGSPEPQWRADASGVTLTLFPATRDHASDAPTTSLNLRQLSAAQRLAPGARFSLAEYLGLIDGAVKERQGRSDLSALCEAGYLRRIGTGTATVYIRTEKPAERLPG